MSKSRSPTAIIAGGMLALLPHSANAQATGSIKVTYCGIGLQGALAEYALANPYSGQFYRNQEFRTALAKALFAAISIGLGYADALHSNHPAPSLT